MIMRACLFIYVIGSLFVYILIRALLCRSFDSFDSLKFPFAARMRDMSKRERREVHGNLFISRARKIWSGTATRALAISATDDTDLRSNEKLPKKSAFGIDGPTFTARLDFLDSVFEHFCRVCGSICDGRFLDRF